jgi:hypothetical protein
MENPSHDRKFEVGDVVRLKGHPKALGLFHVDRVGAAGRGRKLRDIYYLEPLGGGSARDTSHSLNSWVEDDDLILVTKGNPSGKGPWVVWHKPTGCAKVRNGRDEEARLRAAGYREVAQYKSHADADRVADAVWGGRFNPKVMDAKTKDYRCWFCNGAIDVGEKYEVLRGKPYHLGCYEGKKSGEKSWLQKNRNPKLLVLNPSSSVERAAEKKLGRRLSAAESRNLAQAVKEYREFHGRDPETIIPVEVPDGTPKFVNLVGDVDRVDYTVKANSDRRGRWTHKAGDHGRTAKKTIPAFLVSVPGKKAPPVFAQRKDSKMYFKPSHGIMG